MLTPLKTEVLQVEDLSHEARRFRTIVWSFQRNLELLFKDTGLSANVDATALASAFSNWRQAFDKSKYLADVNRHDFVIFAAGLMLRELIAAAPLKAEAEDLPKLPGSVDHRLARWPEGYAYTLRQRSSRNWGTRSRKRRGLRMIRNSGIHSARMRSKIPIRRSVFSTSSAGRSRTGWRRRCRGSEPRLAIRTIRSSTAHSKPSVFPTSSGLR
jgi:hypothetical protein